MYSLPSVISVENLRVAASSFGRLLYSVQIWRVIAQLKVLMAPKRLMGDRGDPRRRVTLTA